ncbi:ATP-binding cassette domain-containing protein [Geoglobus ahangari]
MLTAENLRVVSDGAEILRGVSFGVERGEIVLVVGPNGSGKSTLFKAIMGLRSYEGSVKLDGVNLDGKKPHERFRLGIALAPERMRVAEGLTVRENVEIAGEFADAVRIFPHLERIANRRVDVISGGERQMVVFARAVLSSPKYLLLDEPFQGLADENASRMLEIIERMSGKSGVAVISHERIDDILEVADRVYLMLSGKVRKEIAVEDPGMAMKKLEKYMIV